MGYCNAVYMGCCSTELVHIECSSEEIMVLLSVIDLLLISCVYNYHYTEILLSIKSVQSATPLHHMDEFTCVMM